MNKIISNVIAYMDHLFEREGLLASVHFSEYGYDLANEEAITALLPYRSHNNPYCRFVCSDPVRHERCKANQIEIREKLKSEESIIHTCYAAASEIAYPMHREGELVGFVTVSGYKGEGGERIDPLLWEEALLPMEIPTRLTDVLIPPLVAMLERALYDTAIGAPGELNNILKYVSDSPSDISLDRLARHLGRSRSYISHIFKKKTGKSLRAYCNDLKLVYAKKLLLSTDMSVTEVALDSGFEDTCYFIRLFKEKYGITPHKYKKSNLTIQ